LITPTQLLGHLFFPEELFSPSFFVCSCQLVEYQLGKVRVEQEALTYGWRHGIKVAQTRSVCGWGPTGGAGGVQIPRGSGEIACAKAKKR